MINLRVNPETAATPALLRQAVAKQLGINAADVEDVVICRRSIDARQRNIIVNLSVEPKIKGCPPVPVPSPKPLPMPKLPADARQAIVVGAGPAGLFAAAALIGHGIKPILIERGKDVDSRRLDVAQIARTQSIDPESNYCFGEGGAGAFSDGKLYTRSKKRGPVETVLATLVACGAPADILVDAHPHIGTDRLPYIIRTLREKIVEAGGEVRFSTKVTSLLIEQGECMGVVTASREELRGPVILATGHSARDVYRFLHAQGVRLDAKGIAVGCRVEHPQTLIDSIFYHNPKGRGAFLPPAEYSLLTRVDGRAVYSFCMCPGGVVIPASSGPGLLVVNGMSPARRGTRWANTGMVVEILPDDIEGSSPLKMLDYQESIERRLSEAVEGSQHAPAQRVPDFIAGRASSSLPPSSYPPGIVAMRLDKLLPSEVSSRLSRGLTEFGRKYRGYASGQGVMIGCETRTSSPVTIVRHPETLSHAELPGLYPCGEGAGYAGGIVSAAIDGMRCAAAIAGC
ncbi:MAG: FAD-dependent monooxygenase [Pseudoflavonifractor sp.]|nr:FAD-dependent monooxygenase [Alloprevotella sp.]MCM1117529.1 FAD-dependent monooxygenase [Pseudoflavonifractor sp.]